MHRLCVIACAAFLVACASVPRSDTPSGRPEVTLSKASPTAVKGYITSAMLNAGFTLHKDSQLQLVFIRRGRQPMIEAEWGYKVTYLIVEQPPGARVVAETMMALNVGTPFERPYSTSFRQPTDPQEDVYKKINEVLSGLKAKFSA
jgi:hypothetical protein